MDEIDLLNSDEFELPRNWNPNIGYFDVNIEKLFTDYIQRIHNLQPLTLTGWCIRQNSNLITTIADEIVRTIKAYLSGRPAEAYYILSNLLNTNKTLLWQFIKFKLPDDKVGNLYRVRVSEDPVLTKSEIFHIPFDHRFNVSSSRYSIPGYPCLYLGNSLYVCWEETPYTTYSLTM